MLHRQMWMHSQIICHSARICTHTAPSPSTAPLSNSLTKTALSPLTQPAHLAKTALAQHHEKIEVRDVEAVDAKESTTLGVRWAGGRRWDGTMTNFLQSTWLDEKRKHQYREIWATTNSAANVPPHQIIKLYQYTNQYNLACAFFSSCYWNGIWWVAEVF